MSNQLMSSNENEGAPFQFGVTSSLTKCVFFYYASVISQPCFKPKISRFLFMMPNYFISNFLRNLFELLAGNENRNEWQRFKNGCLLTF